MIADLEERELGAALAIDAEAFSSIELGERSLREELTRPWAHLRGAHDAEGALTGYLLFWHVVDELHLLNVAVDARARRRGIGRALMDDLLTYARAHAIARILLEVRKTNAPAIAMYRSLGFEEFNVRERYYADGEDASEMSLVIQ